MIKDLEKELEEFIEDQFRFIENKNIEIISEVSEDTKEIVNNFPNDLSILTPNALMDLWRNCIGMIEYAHSKLSGAEIGYKICEDIKDFVKGFIFINTKNSDIKTREERKAYADSHKLYKKLLIGSEKFFSDLKIFSFLKEKYKRYVFLCSRELTRRGLRGNEYNNQPPDIRYPNRLILQINLL